MGDKKPPPLNISSERQEMWGQDGGGRWCSVSDSALGQGPRDPHFQLSPLHLFRPEDLGTGSPRGPGSAPDGLQESGSARVTAAAALATGRGRGRSRSHRIIFGSAAWALAACRARAHSLALALSHTHTHTDTRAHAHTHAHVFSLALSLCSPLFIF